MFVDTHYPSTALLYSEKSVLDGKVEREREGDIGSITIWVLIVVVVVNLSVESSRHDSLYT